MTSQPALTRRLTTRVLFFLSIALLPLGIVGWIQNQQLLDEAKKRSELSLLALTEQAVSGEKQLIQRTFGAAQALGEMYVLLRDDLDDCRAFMRNFLSANERFAFVGFTTVDGISECSSANTVLDFSGYENFPGLIEDPRSNIEVNLAAPGSGQSVLIVNEPQYEGDVFRGYISISLPLRDVGESFDFLGDADPVSLVTFNTNGDLLSTEQGRARAANTMPAEIELASLATGTSRTFTAVDGRGEELIYSVVPLKPGVVYALGVWQMERASVLNAIPYVSSSLPILMWMLSVAIIWLVTERFAIVKIRQLNRAMAGFANTRTLPDEPVEGLAIEFEQLDQSFRSMAADIIQDEAKLEDQLRQKTVLLKEVHHRVKNNLQIVSSIMNMQMRKAHEDETRRALRQVQDRIMGLSGIHRTLYQTENLTQVNAAVLIGQIIEQTTALVQDRSATVPIEQSTVDVILFPDQALPMAMWVAETLTNAMKYVGSDDGVVRLTLTLDQDRMARLAVYNTVSDRDGDAFVKDAVSSGLGSQLINAFSMQLNGTTKIEETDDSYTVSIVFPVEDFRPEPLDY